ncbi:uncharacterized protein LOC143534626 [Bidens hawaiensis]|uniref:uncharacterized protein LOC143534532 n=1 Tax=Bidens hawaiensis TaxID=980011 RepID=UPI00404B91AE
MESELLLRQWNPNLKPQPRLGIFGLLRESCKTLKRNMKLMFHVLLFVFILYSQLQFAHMYLLKPVGKDLESQLAKNPKLFEDLGNNMNQTDYSGALNDIREILLVELVFFVLSSIISLLFLVATVSSSSEAYTAKVLNMTEMIMKIKKSWKKPILTSVCMALLTMGLIFMFIFSVGVVSVFAVVTNSWAVYLLFGVGIVVLLISISALWIMSLVVSVLEDAGGFYAINRARELMKGEKVKVSLVMVLYGVTYLAVDRVTNEIVSRTMEKWSGMVMSIVLTNGLSCAMKLFVLVVFTIFYHDQKEICEDKAAKSLYLPIDEV